MANSDLAEVAAALAAPGKGILASDESTGTIGKRLEKAGLQNTEVQPCISSRGPSSQ
jgi:fructose-bisphosphate aldolase class I